MGADGLLHRLRRTVGAVAERALGPFIGAVTRELERRRRRDARRRARRLLPEFPACGRGVEIRGDAYFSDRLAVALGDGAVLEGGLRCMSEGGITVGAGAFVGADVTISTVVRHEKPSGDVEWLPAPVSIGERAYVGPGAFLGPGASVPPGGVVPPGSVVWRPPPGTEGRSERRPSAESGRREWPLGTGEYVPVVARGRDGEADDRPSRLFFGVGSARSGSTSLARMLDQHPDIRCVHERWPQWIRLSTEYARGTKDRERVGEELRDVYRASRPSNTPLYGEVDPKLFNLFGILAELFPASRFIWLVRDGRDVVASRVGRRWYTEYDRESGDPLGGTEWPRYAYWRLQGPECGEFSRAEWGELSPFERNCWAWAYQNESIASRFARLAPERGRVLRIEDLGPELGGCFDFLRVDPASVEPRHVNRADYSIKGWTKWTASERGVFERFCGSLMDRFYPEWREEWASEGSE